MDRSERQNDPIESQRLALEGHQAQMWTALPGIVAGFDPVAMTVSVQPAVQGSVRDERGKSSNVQMPLLVDVPVVFPCGGGFSLTYPIKLGDEALVVFASRCIDGWWQGGESTPPPSGRMHDLSDGMAIIGPRSQATKLDPPVDTDNVQLRTDDGKATLTMKPDYTIEAKNPQAGCHIGSDGVIKFSGAGINFAAKDGGATQAAVSGRMTVDELTSGHVDFNTHYHECPHGGNTSGPKS
ncbi:Gp138 family membrane-puncturing spike protein [uncultured Desulfovibrio sp.]|uniref:Gp138 family membrane-puncturing spike protein n=1 Tax=uncultured Desulfovibrio sp. TaxID=167968 RepID=UPI002608A6CD|nr:Gp138 family membrane-puncturing spike protein [uncultured Desulfovibrio sp.]